ncbi:reverse transcriptase domain-containing protein [Mesorhizobium sp. CA14]|uniref:reverse transcriptase domain-containing protein n=1 Tax=Mesorhizobium sp. CA14 TaxID=2876642 RepID=UPI00398CB482
MLSYYFGEKKRSTVARCLSIGAPTSPKVSNILLYDFDAAMSEKANSLGISYTRYADDITISGNRSDEILLLEKEAKSIIRRMAHPKLTFNDAKRGIYARGRRQMVTGLIVTPQAVVSIGRERKRAISSLLHRSSLGQLDSDRRSLLKGLLGFCAANEPDFIGRLRNKYGNDAVAAAMKFHAPKRARVQAPQPSDLF